MDKPFISGYYSPHGKANGGSAWPRRPLRIALFLPNRRTPIRNGELEMATVDLAFGRQGAGKARHSRMRADRRQGARISIGGRVDQRAAVVAAEGR
jgi:hypothetical protein